MSRRDMADKELRRLKRRELLQMLLVQCQETERLQQELNEIKEQYNTMAESYGRLKKKLDIKDERLNQKDAKILEQRREIEQLQEFNELKRVEVGTIADASLRLNEVLEEALRAAQQYLVNVRKQTGGTLTWNLVSEQEDGPDIISAGENAGDIYGW